MYYYLSFLGETQAQGCVGGGGSSKANGNSVFGEKKQQTGNAMKARSSPCLKSPLLWSWEPPSSAPGQLQFVRPWAFAVPADSSSLFMPPTKECC